MAYTRTEFDTNTDPIQRRITPFIEFVDPDTQQPITTSPDDSSLWRPQGVAGEKITCLLEWMPQKNGHEYHFILIGTARKHQTDRGRVIFLQASRRASNRAQIKCSVKHVHRFKGPVHAIAPYGPLMLMVAAGNDIVPFEPKLSGRPADRMGRYSLLSPATSITVREPYLYLTTSRESLIVLKVHNEKLMLHAHDRQKLDGLSHAHLGDANLAVTSSRGGRVSLLTEAGVTASEKMMPAALADAHLPASAMKLTVGTKSSPVAHPHVIYATTLNGAVYRFLVLTTQEWCLLRLLQNLCIRDPVICQFTPKKKRKRNPVEIEPGDRPSQMHIDGDILNRLAERGAGYLQQMLATTAFDNPFSVDGGSAPATGAAFVESAQALLGRSSNPPEVVIRWLRGLLHVGF